jgi:hypothetical protein
VLKDLKINLHELDRAHAHALAGLTPMEVRYDVLESSGARFRMGDDQHICVKLVRLSWKWAEGISKSLQIDEDAWARVEHGVLTEDGGVL